MSDKETETTTYRGLTRDAYRMAYREASRLYDESTTSASTARWSKECVRIADILNRWEALTDDR